VTLRHLSPPKLSYILTQIVLLWDGVRVRSVSNKRRRRGSKAPFDRRGLSMWAWPRKSAYVPYGRAL
jgi:hypothetical protein